MLVVIVSSKCQHASLSPLRKIIRLYNLKRHINEIHTATHNVATTHGWITSSTLPPHGGAAPRPLSHGRVTPTPPQHDGVTYHHSGVTPPPPLHGGVTPLHCGVTPPHHGGVTPPPPPPPHGRVTPPRPPPPRHGGVIPLHGGVTPPPPPPPPPHGGVTPPHVGVTPAPPPPHDGVNHSMYGVSVTRGPFVFQHPMTMNVCGPTCCEKTTWLKQLLLNVDKMIQPRPHYIFWFYKRWQPIYTELKKKLNKIKFIQDLMRDATKNSDICELYAEGSHHRNLSVICLLQNIYHHGREN